MSHCACGLGGAVIKTLPPRQRGSGRGCRRESWGKLDVQMFPEAMAGIARSTDESELTFGTVLTVFLNHV